VPSYFQISKDFAAIGKSKTNNIFIGERRQYSNFRLKKEELASEQTSSMRGK
jgi:hypothetical protein